jgi:hypothetical protein
MRPKSYKRNDIIDCVVVGHARWGVLIRTPSDEPGWIEPDYLDDKRALQQDWPRVGTVVTAVALDSTGDGRWWLSSRPSSLNEARAGIAASQCAR